MIFCSTPELTLTLGAFGSLLEVDYSVSSRQHRQKVRPSGEQPRRVLAANPTDSLPAPMPNTLLPNRFSKYFSRNRSGNSRVSGKLRQRNRWRHSGSTQPDCYILNRNSYIGCPSAKPRFSFAMFQYFRSYFMFCKKNKPTFRENTVTSFTVQKWTLGVLLRRKQRCMVLYHSHRYSFFFKKGTNRFIA